MAVGQEPSCGRLAGSYKPKGKREQVHLSWGKELFVRRKLTKSQGTLLLGRATVERPSPATWGKPEGPLRRKRIVQKEEKMNC
ncbi:hypothetical protein Y1Q_0020012 [Alligator mississippiensis]|uniref:Uncharacterized protein n=1 Tax=Alligator mississippiensis TaxID=8496 RepID=A0A151LYR6_ALLMI|nr:hypothetical protein Y1Q_0020012 [Alligator mississippiensis]